MERDSVHMISEVCGTQTRRSLPPRMAVVITAALFWLCQNSLSNNVQGCTLFDERAILAAGNKPWIEELDIPVSSYVSLDGKSLRGVFKMSVLNAAAYFKPKFAFCKLSIICTFSLRCERA